jgi:excisionase family DNA binding protein
MNSNLLTAKEVAERLGICRSQAYKLCKQGDIPKVQIRSSVRVKEEDLEQYIIDKRIGSNYPHLITKLAGQTASLETKQVNPIFRKEFTHE